MSDVRSVVVAGSRFGQFYAAGVAADPRFVLRGILGQGSRRSRALAERLGVETWCEVEALPDDVRLACVAVGGAARGEQGPALAEALMARGIDVLIEHPLLPREWQDLLRSAERLGRRCLLNTFYPQLPAVARFIELGRQLHRRRGIRHLDAACGVQVGFATLDILAALLEGVGPWSLESPSNDLSAMRGLSLVLAEVPLSLLVLNELAAADDGRMTLLQRVSLTTDRGTLSLLSPHGPLLWTPAVAVPAEDDDGLFALFDEIAGEPLPSAQLWYAEPCNWAQVHQLLWPAAAAEALALLADGDEVRRRNQRSLEVAALWQRIGECLGFPEAPPASLAPASISRPASSACMRKPASGVFSWCAASARNCFCVRIDWSSRVSNSLIAPTSGTTSSGTPRASIGLRSVLSRRRMRCCWWWMRPLWSVRWCWSDRRCGWACPQLSC